MSGLLDRVRHALIWAAGPGEESQAMDDVRTIADLLSESRPAPEGYALVPIDERADDILLTLSLNRISVDEAKAAMIAAAQEKEGRG